MKDTERPDFSKWDRALLDHFCEEIWDTNARLREANEQLRLDNKDLSRLLREANTKGTT